MQTTKTEGKIQTDCHEAKIENFENKWKRLTIFQIGLNRDRQQNKNDPCKLKSVQRILTFRLGSSRNLEDQNVEHTKRLKVLKLSLSGTASPKTTDDDDDDGEINEAVMVSSDSPNVIAQ